MKKKAGRRRPRCLNGGLLIIAKAGNHVHKLKAGDHVRKLVYKAGRLPLGNLLIQGQNKYKDQKVVDLCCRMDYVASSMNLSQQLLKYEVIHSLIDAFHQDLTRSS